MRHFKISHRWLVQAISCLFMTASYAQVTISEDQLTYFENHVRPNLIKYCYECHSEESGRSYGGLLLDTREGMLEGGSGGSVFDDRDWKESLFTIAIKRQDPSFAMPPDNKLPDDVLEKLEKWVQLGHFDPRERKAFAKVQSEIDIEAGKEHWAYQSPVRPSGKSIDEIIAEKRDQEGLSPVGQASSVDLLRRLHFDLTGLPPTPAEIKAFVRAAEQDRDKAVEQKLDQLLGSEQYGERWGRHWLDAARYGESSGTVNALYPYAWRYRDYIIDAFNADKPYDQMVREQLAGDLLPFKNDMDRQSKLIATGFLAIGPKKQNEKNPRIFEMNLIDEQIDTTTRAFMGTTLACARCHDHKFDPIPTTDYYAMAGIFKSTETLYGTIAGNQNHRTTQLLTLPIPDQQVDAVEEAKIYQQKKEQLADLKKENKKKRAEVRAAENGKGELPENFSQRELVAMRQRIMRLESELKFLNPDGTSATFGMGVQDGTVDDCNVLVYGDVTKEAQLVKRGFPQVLHFEDTPEIPADSSGRLELAEWMSSPNNPLTARVMVNRIWMHLTGTPIVETVNNFGILGMPPTNQELLDYLAVQFMEEGWSIKKCVREIVLSETYQLAVTFHAENYEKDPDNHTYWRANSRQLDAESLRDAMLLVSGQLDRARPFASLTYEVGNTLVGRRTSSELFSGATFKYRSVYLPIVRDALPDELALFDFPDPMGTVGQRRPSNVAPQSLFLMNSQLVVSQARAMAKLLEKNFSTQTEQVKNGILLCYGRPATKEEVMRSLSFLSSFEPNTGASASKATQSEPPNTRRRRGTMEQGEERQRGRRKGGQATDTATKPLEVLSDKEEALAVFCQALMMSSEFRIVN